MQVKEATIKTIKGNKSRANYRAKAKRKNPIVERIVLQSVRQCTGDAVSICAQVGGLEKEDMAGTFATITFKTLVCVRVLLFFLFRFFFPSSLAACSCGCLVMPNRFAL